MRALFADQCRRARQQHGVRSGHNGAVTFIQRFGSALNLTPHFHSLVLDGVFAGPAHDPGPFLPLPPPETEDVARVMAGTARRVMRCLEKRGLESDEDPLASNDPLLATLMSASVRSRIATGPEAGEPWLRVGDRVEMIGEEEGGTQAISEIPPRCVREGGMSLHADVAVPARDRRRLERLCRYMARPALAMNRLEATPDGRLAYRLKTRWRDGTSHILMERHELLERLAPLIPPPRAHQVRYHGVLAPCASGRDRVVPNTAKPFQPPPASVEQDEIPGANFLEGKAERREPLAAEGESHPLAADLIHPEGSLDSEADPGKVAVDHNKGVRTPSAPAARRHSWAELLQRVFEVDALRCPSCGERMRLMAAITDPMIARRILKCLGLPPRAPPLTPAASPEPTAISWFSEPEVFDFDQTPPTEWNQGG